MNNNIKQTLIIHLSELQRKDCDGELFVDNCLLSNEALFSSRILILNGITHSSTIVSTKINKVLDLTLNIAGYTYISILFSPLCTCF